jgi:hypothetical protein
MKRKTTDERRWLRPPASQDHPLVERWFVNGLGKRLVYERVVIRDGERRRALIEQINGKWVVGVSYARLTCGVPHEWTVRSLQEALREADSCLESPRWWNLPDEIDRLFPY